MTRSDRSERPMRILLTGAAGFIASHVADRYIDAGHEVVIVDNLSTGRRTNVNPRARLHVVDINDPAVTDLVRHEKPDVINHHAAQIDVRRSVAEPINDVRTNVEATLRLALAGLACGTRRFIFASTGGAIYGEQETFPATESHPVNPLSPYGASKLAAEKYLATLAYNSGLEVVCLRYANVYGPRQSPHGEAGVVAIFSERLLAGRPAMVNGDGLQTRDYVHVADVAQANVLALTTERPGTYNIGTGIETSVLEIHRLLARAAGFEGLAVHAEAKPGEQRRSCIDSSRAKNALGWRPQVLLADGLKQTLESFR
jgi:UDP-glucose 4-epimerase